MWILIISLIALAVVAAIAGTVRNRRLQKKIDNGELDAMPEVQEVDAECCRSTLSRTQKGSLSWMLVIPLRISRKRRPCISGG